LFPFALAALVLAGPPARRAPHALVAAAGHGRAASARPGAPTLRRAVAPPARALSSRRPVAASRPARPVTTGARPAVDVVRDLVYARTPQRPLRLDLYLPAAAPRPLPVVVWIHGGAWRIGGKSPCPAARLASRGYAVASIEYRFSHEALFPAQIEDCKAAVRWLRAHAPIYGLDPRRIGAWGASAGGHLAALLGVTGRLRAFDVGEHLEQSSAVQAVCDFFGPTDFLRMDDPDGPRRHDRRDSAEGRLIGAAPSARPDLALWASPLVYVDRHAPPFLIVHGELDRIVPLRQSELLLADLREAGVWAELMVVRGARHGFRCREVDVAVDRFFDTWLRDAHTTASR